MKSNFKLKRYLIGSIIGIFLAGCSASRLVNLKRENVRSINREISVTEKALELNAAEGSGLAILKNVSFINGTMQLDIKGENNPGKSFVGVAFNIKNDSTYEAIYFRPFNFGSPKKIRREHSIQYIFEPDNSWKKLRTENPGEFEAEFANQPSPDDWFSISLNVQNDRVTVKDAGSGKLLMQVDRLTTTTSDKIGFWVGNNSKGSFRDLRIR